MGTLLYYLLTFAEAGLGVFGIRAPYEQPRYTIVENLPNGTEIRDYAPRLAVETDDPGDGSAAFGRLFRYITGANAVAAKVAMTVPVAQSGGRIAMTAPVARAPGVMRFFLPTRFTLADAPMPTDSQVRLVPVPAERLAVRRFAGQADPATAGAQTKLLLQALAAAGRVPSGTPQLLTYDPPFAIPPLRRNEIAVALAPA